MLSTLNSSLFTEISSSEQEALSGGRVRIKIKVQSNSAHINQKAYGGFAIHGDASANNIVELGQSNS